MRKLLIGFVALIVVVVAGVLIGPSFIDWNSYKSEIAAQVKSLTGRDLVIGGDIKIAILPAPAVIANDVTFANIAGGSEPYMARLSSLAVNVALGPLLGGDIQVTKVRLVDPVVVLEIIGDGRQNWVLESGRAKDASASTGGGTPSATIDLATGQQPADAGDEAGEPAGNAVGDMAGPGLQLDNFEIINGTIIYRDATSATEERVDGLNATVKAVSMSGPFESIGSLVVRGIPLSYEIGVDGVFQGRTVPVNAMIRSGKSDASVLINGTIVNLSNDAKFTGKLKAEGPSLASTIAALAPSGELPGGLNQPYSAEGVVVATASAVSISPLEIKLGEATASGTVSASLLPDVSASVDLTIGHINLDKLMALPAFGGRAQNANDNSAPTSDGQPATDTPTANTGADAAGQTPDAAAGFSLPAQITASLSLGIDAITYRDEKAGPVRLNAELANGEITLSQFTTQLPGATDVAMFGFVSAPEGTPVFDGEAEISVGDTRSLTKWLQVGLPELPNGRLRHMTATTKIKATPENIQLSGMNVAFDGSNLKGGITVALRQRLAFGASFVLDRIDLDGYLPVIDAGTSASPSASASASASAGAAEGTQSVTGENTASTAASTEADPLAVLSALTAFDANLKASIGEIVHQGTQIHTVEFDGTLFDGALTVKKAGVADLAGASVSLSGAVSALGGNPRFGDLAVNFKAQSLQKLADFLAFDLPVSAEALGAVAAAVTLDGPVLQPTVKLSANAAGGQGTFDGGISLLPLKDAVKGVVTLSHGDIAKLLRSFGVAYQPSGKIGGLTLSTRVSGGAEQITLDDVAGELGAVRFNGSSQVRLDGAVPNVTASINTNEFVVDPFIPVQKNAAAAPQSFGVQSRPVISKGAPWSDDPLDLSALKGLNGEFHLHADAVRYGAYRLEDAYVDATLLDGVLKTDRATARLFDGQIDVNGLVNAQGVPAADATVSYKNASVSAMLAALTGQPTATGAFTFDTALKAQGASVADMVAALDGTGSFLLKGLNVKGATKGTALAGILGLAQGFGQLGAGLSGQPADSLADATGSFILNKGIAKIGDFQLVSGMGNGSATGSVDLVRWQMDVSGVMKVAQNILGQLLTQKAGAPQELPFRVSGALDEPTVKLETAALGNAIGSGAVVPGLEKLEEKVPGIGGLLQGVLGGTLGGATGTGATQQQPVPQPQTQAPSSQDMPESQPEPQPQPQPQPQAPEAQPLTPENVLKQLFKF